MPALKNPKHEAFCRNRVYQQMAIGAAYRAAGYKGGKGGKANATRLSQRPEIVARIAELQVKLEEKTGWTAEKRLKTLEDIAGRNERKDPKTTISAIAEANKMQGSYAPAKSEVTGKDGGPIQHLDLTKMSNDDLDKLESILGRTAGRDDDPATGQGGEGEARG